MNRALVVLTAQAQEHMRGLPKHAYFLAAADDELYYVIEVQDPVKDVRYGRGVLLPREHPMSHTSARTQGAFHRVSADAHRALIAIHIRDAHLTFEGLRHYIPEIELVDSGLVITQARHHEEEQVPEFLAWHVTPAGALGIPLDAEPVGRRLAALGGRWPLEVTRGAHAIVVGAGTIGSHAALGLASYGFGTLTVVDPQRLQYRNLRRLGYQAADVGRFKVALLAERIRREWPDTIVAPHEADIVEDIDAYRDLAGNVDVIVGATDGVIARRVCNYLGRRAGTDVVLGCVLDDGALTEVLRLRTGPALGCLDCQRASLRDSGSLDGSYQPEPDLHAPYGDGFLHKPMTAVGGDLHLAGSLTAKVAAATVLENAGHGEHTLPGDVLLVTNSATDLAEPFGARAALTSRWLPPAPPRSGCFTCRTQSHRDAA